MCGLIISFFYFCSIALSSEVVIDQLKEKEEHSIPLVQEKFPSGAPKTVVYFQPVKELRYDQQGRIESERNVAVLEGEKSLVPHGVGVDYDSSGSITTVSHYRKGKLNGEVLEYYPSGSLKKKTHYYDNIKEGKELSFYESGVKRCESYYKKGSLHGSCLLWYSDKTIRAEKHYTFGVLEDHEEKEASILYYPNGKVAEKQSFFKGKPHGDYYRFYLNGQKQYHVQYIYGKKQGMESFFSAEGVLQGEGRFIKGCPVGKHIRKHSNGKIAMVASYDHEGKLLKPIQEFDQRGNQRADVRSIEGKEGADFFEWHALEKNELEYEEELLNYTERDSKLSFFSKPKSAILK